MVSSGAKRKRIGFLWPADGVNEAEYRCFVPPDFDWLVARYTAETTTEELTPDVLSAYAEPEVLMRAAGLLRAVSPDVVACGDHAASFIAGAVGAAEMADAVQDVLGCPVTTMAEATQDALRVLNAQTIAVFSPYSEEVTDALLDSLRNAGFRTVAHHVLGAISEEDIGTHLASDWLPEILAFVDALSERPDALFLAGGGVCFADGIERFEAESGLPIVTAPGALVRQAVLMAGGTPERAGLGKLFRANDIQSGTVLKQHQSTGTKSFSVSEAPPVFVSGAGPWLISEEGRSYLDFACGSGTTALGHGHPVLKAAMKAQVASGVTHLGPHFHAPVQARVYELLTGMMPKQLMRFHPSVSGAEATEVALKAAMHSTGARRFIGFVGGYHGRTFGALSVSGARGKNETLTPFAPEAEILPFPIDMQTGETVADQIRNSDVPLAGIIIEPIQATAGLRMAHADGLRSIADAARDCEIPLIVDEVFTGFGRTGRLFSFQAFDIAPDLVILAKSFGGGSACGLVAGTEDVLGRWPKGVQTSTFQLHPLAAATAEAFLNVVLREDLPTRSKMLEPAFKAAFSPCLAHSAVRDLRGQGAFWALEMARSQDAFAVRQAALSQGLLTWESGLDGETVCFVPPLIVDEAHIKRAGAMFKRALHASLGTS